MADTLGIAAAGAGFLSLAGQVLDGVIKLQGFIAAVDSAPREIHDLCQELDIFRGLLGEAGHRIQESLPVGVDTNHLKYAFTHCEKMRGHAESVLKRLEVNINRSKTTSALRYPFKRKEIESMLLSVERGKTSLLLANQSFESSLAARRHVVLSGGHDLLLYQQRMINEEIAQAFSKTTAATNLQEEKFASITHAVATSTQVSRVQTQGLKEAYAEGCREIHDALSQLQDQSKSISSSVTGQVQQIQCIGTSIINAGLAITDVNARLEALTLQIASQAQTEIATRTTLSFRLIPLSITFEQISSHNQRTLTRTKRATRIFTVRLPKWFLHRQYDLQLLYATSGWPFTLNTCSIALPESPFFNACREGDIETIKFLLSKQQASIFDRTPCGTTAFQFAISHSQLEVCKLLRYAGIFSRFDDSDYLNSLRGLENSLDDFTEHNFSLLHVAAPLNNSDQDWFKDYCQTKLDDGTTMVHVDIELFSLLNSAQRDTAMLDVAHLKAYFECRSNNGRYGYFSFMPYIVRVLSNNFTVHEITASGDKFAWIVYALAGEIAQAYLRKRRQTYADQWSHSIRQALCAVVRAGLNPHQISGKLESPWVSDDWYKGLNMTPLGLLCVEVTRIHVKLGIGTQNEWNEDLNARLQLWLLGLDSAGIDLLQYAKSESACFGCALGSLAIPWKTDGTIMVVTGPRPEDWHISLWIPCESYARLFWCIAEGKPVVPGLTAKIMEAYAPSASEGLTIYVLPGSWPPDPACIAKALESWLLRRTDEDLTQIEEDLTSLSENDFFAKWHQIGDVLRGSTWVTMCCGCEHSVC